MGEHYAHARGLERSMVKFGFSAIAIAMVAASCASQTSTDSRPSFPNSFAAFEMIDDDKSHTISFQEWQRSVEAAASHVPAEPTAQDFRCQLIRLFGRLDLDRDGLLSRVEWGTGKFESFSPCI